jgi:hypothetical protein
MPTSRKPDKKRIQAGVWCRVRWDDVGCVDGLIVSVNRVDKSCVVYGLAAKLIQCVEFSQIISTGNYVKATDTGL